MTEKGHARVNTKLTRDQGHAPIRSTESIVDTPLQMSHPHLPATHVTENTGSDLTLMIRKRRAKGRNLVGHLRKRKSARCKLVWQRPECLHRFNSPIQMQLLMTLICLTMRSPRKTHLNFQLIHQMNLKQLYLKSFKYKQKS